MFIIQEIQTDANNNVTFLPQVVKATQAEAESEYYIKLGYAAISSVPVHAVIMYTHEGFPLMHGVYKHEVQPEPTPVEPEEPEEPEEDIDNEG